MKNNSAAKKSGFTLIELLVVVLIIGILAAIALPQYRKAVNKSKASQAYVTGKALLKAQQVFYQAYGYYTDDMNLLDINQPYTSWAVETCCAGKTYYAGDFNIALRPAATTHNALVVVTHPQTTLR